MNRENLPPPPPPPPCRVEYGGAFGRRMFKSAQEFEAWTREPLWRRLLGLTAYDRRSVKP